MMLLIAFIALYFVFAFGWLYKISHNRNNGWDKQELKEFAIDFVKIHDGSSFSYFVKHNPSYSMVRSERQYFIKRILRIQSIIVHPV